MTSVQLFRPTSTAILTDTEIDYIYAIFDIEISIILTMRICNIYLITIELYFIYFLASINITI